MWNILDLIFDFTRIVIQTAAWQFKRENCPDADTGLTNNDATQQFC